jgi:O-antigen/teichoic acid export membrane protein
LGWFATSYGATLLGYFGLNSIASRMLGPAQFGYFAIALSATSFMGQIALVGANRSGLRDAARMQSNDPALLERLRGASRAVSVVTLPTAGALSGSLTWFLQPDAGWWERAQICFCVGALVVLSGQLKLWAGYLRGFGHIRLASLLEGRSGGAAAAVIQAMLLLLLLVTEPTAGLAAALVMAALGYLIPVLFAWRTAGHHWHTASQPWRLRAHARGVISRDWRFASAQMSGYLHSNLELLMAGVLLPSTATSLFGAADRLVVLLAVPLTTLTIVFSPVVARLSDSDPELTERLLRTGATMATVVTAIAWVPMLLFPGPLLAIVYGHAYRPAALALSILTLGYLANVATGLTVTALSMTDNEGSLASVMWLGLVLRLCLAIPAALLFGVLGLAISEATASVVTILVIWRRSVALTGLNTHLTLRPNVRLLLRTTS